MAQDAPVNPGQILLLNGNSSSGKSTLAQELQKILDRTFLSTGLDHFLERLPRSLFVYHEGEHPPTADGWLLVFEKGRFLRAEIGPAGLRFLMGMYRAFAALSRSGVDLIVDDVIYDPRVLRAAVEALADLPAYFIGVRLPVELAEARESARCDRAPGGAAFFGARVHRSGIYDFEVDTSLCPAVKGARQVKDWLAGNPQPAAFRRLREQMRESKEI